jgi:hypothetical protein
VKREEKERERRGIHVRRSSRCVDITEYGAGLIITRGKAAHDS